MTFRKFIMLVKVAHGNTTMLNMYCYTDLCVDIQISISSSKNLGPILKCLHAEYNDNNKPRVTQCTHLGKSVIRSKNMYQYY